MEDHYKNKHPMILEAKEEIAHIFKTNYIKKKKILSKPSKPPKKGYIRCPRCEKGIFPRKANLLRHYRNIHNDIVDSSFEEISRTVNPNPNPHNKRRCPFCGILKGYHALYKYHLRLSHKKLCSKVDSREVAEIMNKARMSRQFDNQWTRQQIAKAKHLTQTEQLKSQEFTYPLIFGEDTLVDSKILTRESLKWSMSLSGSNTVLDLDVRDKVLDNVKLTDREKRDTKQVFEENNRQKAVLEFYFGLQKFQIKELERYKDFLHDSHELRRFRQSRHRRGGTVSYLTVSKYLQSTINLLSFVRDNTEDSLSRKLEKVEAKLRKGIGSISSYSSRKKSMESKLIVDYDHLVNMADIGAIFSKARVKMVIQSALNFNAKSKAEALHNFPNTEMTVLKGIVFILLAFKTGKRSQVLRSLTIQNVYDAIPVTANGINLMRILVHPDQAYFKTAPQSIVVIPMDVYNLTLALAKIMSSQGFDGNTSIMAKQNSTSAADFAYFAEKLCRNILQERKSLNVPNLTSNNVRRTVIHTLFMEQFVTSDELAGLAHNMEHKKITQERTYLVEKTNMPLVRFEPPPAECPIILHPTNLINVTVTIDHWDKPSLDEECELYRELHRRMKKFPSDRILTSYPNMLTKF